MCGCVASTRNPSQILHLHSKSCFWLSLLPSQPILALSASLLPNILPRLQALVNFVTNTLPKPVLVALLYRLGILHLASRILPTIGVDSWETEENDDDEWNGRPVCNPAPLKRFFLIPLAQTSTLTRILLTYRQAIFVTVYSHLLCRFVSVRSSSYCDNRFQCSIIPLRSGGDG